ncbi:MAG TPA: ATP-grasp domain-containing protein [Thermomicrobiaceae bacterium]|nr:ATP-grasp domain-containing protein [Thermomicrobiaceae bacterium]
MGSWLEGRPATATLERVPALPTPTPTPAPAGALVIGGDYRGLGVVRSLGRAGVPVWVLTDEHRLAAASRYSRRDLPFPTAANDETQVAFLLDVARRYGLRGWALFPTGDETAALIARHHERLAEHLALTTPPWPALRWAYDKRLTHQLADEAGVASPWTRYPASRAEVLALDCDFPVILKPAAKPEANALTMAKAWRVESREELLARYDAACRLLPPELLMVQELIPGGGECQLSYAALCVDGRPLASITARRTRQWPVDFGRASTYVETVAAPEVDAAARRLIAAMGYAGLVELEFKRDPRSGVLKLIDINPRVWGWHSLGRRAGVDFPALQWRLLRGEAVAERQAAAGVRWVRMTTDLPTVAREILGRRLSPLRYLWSLRRPIEFAIWALDDPVPAAVELPLIVRLALARGSL